MSSDNFPCRIFEARYPKTKRSASMVLDFPDPFGPTIAENDWRRELIIRKDKGKVSDLVEGANFLTSSITLEIDQRDLVYDEARLWTLGFLRGRRRGLTR